MCLPILTSHEKFVLLRNNLKRLEESLKEERARKKELRTKSVEVHLKM
jgi:hypothetical protein